MKPKGFTEAGAGRRGVAQGQAVTQGEREAGRPLTRSRRSDCVGAESSQLLRTGQGETEAG